MKVPSDVYFSSSSCSLAKWNFSSSSHMRCYTRKLFYPFHVRKKISALCHRHKDKSTVPGPNIVRSPSATLQSVTAPLVLSINHTPYNVVSAFNLFGTVAIIQVR